MADAMGQEALVATLFRYGRHPGNCMYLLEWLVDDLTGIDMHTGDSHHVAVRNCYHHLVYCGRRHSRVNSEQMGGDAVREARLQLE